MRKKMYFCTLIHRNNTKLNPIKAMAKQKEQEALEVAMDRTEDFFERNSKKIITVLAVLIVAAALIFGYRELITLPRMKRAAELMAEAQYRFEGENPDFELALTGDANGAGFLDVIDQYGSTPAGNLAKHYAGICYLRTGDLDNAAAYLAKYRPVRGIPGAIINAQNLGLQGDLAVERQDYAAALKCYDKAIEASDNTMTVPLYLRKAGMAAKAMGDTERSTAYYQRILDTYPLTPEAREAEKLIGTNN